MSIVTFLSDLRKKDIRLTLDGEKLKINAPAGALTDEIKIQLRDRKAEIMAFLQEADQSRDTSIPVAIREGDLPLSYSQQRLWFMEQLNPGSAVFNMPCILKISGPLDIEILRKAFEEIVRRHDSLRTRFEMRNGEGTQIIEPASNWLLPVEDVSDFAAEEKENKVREFIAQESLTPFNLSKGPLLRTRVLVVKKNAANEKQEHIVAFNMHHIISDGWSIDVLMRELIIFYDAYAKGKTSPLTELPIQYVDFAIWQRNWLKGDTLKKQIDYWKKHLKGAPQSIALPTDRPRQANHAARGAEYSHWISKAQFDALSEFCQKNSVTTFMVMLAALQVLLAKMTGERDICVGTPIAGRNRAELENLIGFFLNGMVMRTRLDGNPVTGKIIERVKETCLGAFANQDVPAEMWMYEMGVDRSLNHIPGAQIAFILQNTAAAKSNKEPQALGALTIEQVETVTGTAKHEICLMATESVDGILCVFEYDADLFNSDTIATFANRYDHVLNVLINDTEATIESLCIYSQDELVALLQLDASNVDEVRMLTAMQRDMFVAAQINPQTLANSLGGAVIFEGNLDLECWHHCVEYVAERQSALRTRLIRSDNTPGEMAWQVVEKKSAIKYESRDFRKLNWSWNEAIEYAKKFVYRPFNFATDLLNEFAIIRLSETRTVFIVRAHHAVLDGGGVTQSGVLAVDVYNAIKSNQPLPLWEDKFGEYALLDRKTVDSHEVTDFWQSKLNTVEALTFNVPQDGGAPNSAYGYEPVEAKRLILAREHWNNIKTWTRQQRITPPIYFKVLYGILLQLYCRPENNFYITEILGARPRGHGATLGNYIQQQPFIFPQQLFKPDTSFESMMAYARDYQKETRDYALLSIQKQNEMLPRGAISFMYNFYHFVPSPEFVGSQVQTEGLMNDVDGVVEFTPKTLAGDMELNLRFQSSRFKDFNFLERIEFLSQQIQAGAKTLGELRWVNDAEQQTILAQFATSADTFSVDFDTCILHKLFEQQVALTPSNIALVSGNKTVSYAELNQKANALALKLINAGVQPKSYIPVLMTRSLDVPLAMLAVMKAGAAFVCLDISWPADRLNRVLASLSSSVILTNQAGNEWQQFTLTLIQVNLFELDQLEKSPSVSVEPNDPVYVLYTSGSTGEPKGAINIHRGVAHHVLHLAQHCHYTPDDVSLQVSYHTFDSAIEELFTPLICGARVVIPETRSGFDLDLIIELIDSHKITVASIVPSVFNMLVEAMQAEKIRQRVASLKHLLLGGETVTAKTAYKFRRWFSHARITNTYGPSECSVAVIYHPVPAMGGDSVPIGRPIHQVYALILDSQQRILPAGVPGELYLAGVCVGAGYYQNAVETEKAFCRNLFLLPGNDARIASDIIYKTGDLCRYLNDGNIDFIGRIDQQVKIHGRRLELAEVEAAIGRFPSVKEQAVIVKGETANARLVAYVVSTEADNLNVNELRQFLKEHLAEFMIPSAFVVIDKMPVTSNGKLDKRALPEPEFESVRSSVAYVAPRNAVEQRVVEIWQDVLAHSPIGVNDDFFELGGHSLLATKVVSRVRALFQIELPLRILFENPTVAELALAVEGAQLTDQSLAQSVIEKVDRTKPIALSYAQQRLWFMDQLEPNNVAFNMPVALRVIGELDVRVLEQAFTEIVRRHDSLRTSFAAKDGVGFQKIQPFKSWHLQKLDLSALTTSAKENEIIQRARTDARMPFNLSIGPLFRAQIILLGKNNQAQDEYVLLLNMHHIISDGWSMGVLVKEMGTLYIAYRQGLSSPLPELSIQYADFAAWQRQHLAGERLEKQLSWWKQQLSGAPEMLRLPTDKPRPKVKTSRGATVKLQFNADENRAIKQFCRQQGTTPFILFLAAYQFLLSRYSGQKDICVGVPISGRSRLEVENLIGFFINGVILRTQLNNNPMVSELIARAKETTLGAFAHQDVPVEMVVDAISQERTLTHQPGAQAGFNFHTAAQPKFDLLGSQQISNLVIEQIPISMGVAKNDVSLTLAEFNNEFFGELEYNTDLFEQATVQRMGEHFKHALKAMLENVDVQIDSLELVQSSELMQLLNLDAEYEAVRPLTAMQRDMYLDNIANPTSLQSSHGFAVIIPAELDAIRWQQSLQAFSDKQSVLRTKFVAAPVSYTDVAYQAVRKSYPINFELLDWSSQQTNDDQLQRAIFAKIYRPYNVVDDELVNYVLIKLSKNRYCFILAVHHGILDGTAINALWPQICAHYEEKLNANQFEADVFAEQVKFDRTNMDTSSVRAFWREKLANCEPLDFTSPWLVAESENGAPYITRTHYFVDEHWKAVRSFCRKNGITPALYFKCLFGLMLQNYCRPRADFAIQETMAGRSEAGHAAAQGCYIQEIPFVFPLAVLEGSKSVQDLFDYAKAFQREIKAQRKISIGLTAELSPRGRLGFMYNFYHFLSAVDFLGHHFECEGTPSDPAGNVQFVITVVGEKLKLNLFYHRDVFNDLEFLARVDALSQQIINSSLGAEVSLTDLRFVTEINEIEQQLFVWNDTQRAYDLTQCLHQRFEALVKIQPDAQAAYYNDESLTYSQLNQRANQLARALVEWGVQRGELVGLCADRSLDFLIGVVAIFKATAAYVPMDTGYPDERIHYMMQNSQVRVVLTQIKQLARLSEFSDRKRFCLDTEWEQVSQFDNTNLNLPCDSSDRAYMIYTSGSTGQPKGAIIRHNGALNHIEAELDYLNLRQIHFLQTAPASSDISVWQFVGPIVTGGHVVILDEVTNAEKLFKLIKTQSVNVIELVPVVLQLLLEYVSHLTEIQRALPNLKVMMATGEAVPVPLLNRWLTIYPAIPATNAYGPTEAADDVIQFTITQPIPPEQRSVPIGKPLANLNVFILDECMRLVPAGVPGEICISGIGVGEGYWQMPERTRQSFISNPFKSTLGDVIYKTGDIGRWLRDGSIEYCDRMDNQVKIRGYRIELGEIEAQFAKYPSIKESVVVVREDIPGDKTLAAYAVIASGEIANENEIKAFMKARLPQYMVPNTISFLPALPTTPAGKIDRKNLPKPSTDSRAGNLVLPRNSIETTLAEIWADVLSLPQVGVMDSFFDLGGHSILAVRVIARVKSEFGVEIPLRKLFEAPTIASFAESITIADPAQHILIPKRAQSALVPLSYQQQRIWFIEQMMPGGGAYNMPVALRIHGELDINLLQQVFNSLVQRHAALRTTFVKKNSEVSQRISEFSPNEIKVLFTDLSAYARQEREDLLQQTALAEFSYQFDLENENLIRVRVLKLADHESVLLANMHHIISDGWSVGIILKELVSLYAAERFDAPISLADAPIDYADYSVWQRATLVGNSLAEKIEFWKRHLFDAPILALPTDFARPTVISSRAAAVPVAISDALISKLKHFSAQHNASLFMTMLAAFRILLSRYSQQQDIVIGIPIANRANAELENVVGFFANTLALRNSINSNQTFTHYLQTERDVLLNAQSHQDVPFEKIVEELNVPRDTSLTPLFQVMFNLVNAPALANLPEIGDFKLSALEIDYHAAKFDLSMELTERQGNVNGLLVYRTDLFLPETMECFTAHYVRLLESIASEPAQEVGLIRVLSDAEIKKQLVEFNSHKTEIEQRRTIVHQFMDVVHSTPNAAAITLGASTLSYKELNIRIDQVASWLKDNGVKKGDRVAICMGRSNDLPVAIFAALKLGAAYVPMDSNYPAERLSYILEDAAAPVLITQTDILERLGELKSKTLCLNSAWYQANTADSISIDATPDDTIYLIYTSGSTGLPKGAQVTHRGEYNLQKWYTHLSELTSNDKTLLISALGFDLTQKNIFAVLITGGTLVFPEMNQFDPEIIQREIEQHKITLLNCAPSMFYTLVEQNTERLNSLRYVYLGGEPIRMERVKPWLTSSNCHAKIVNSYGPTECTDVVSYYVLDPNRNDIPLGIPVENTELYVLSEQNQLLPWGAIGELCVAGIQVGQGYLNRPELNAAAFIPNPFGDGYLYRTGDLAKFNDRNELVYLGRKDFQIKLRGVRIELAEIEIALRELNGIKDSLVIKRGEQLVAYVVVTDLFMAENWKYFLARKLPEFMLPSALIALNEWPLTPNGKVDRNALPSPELSSAQEFIAPRTVLEEKLHTAWIAALNVESISILDNFFERGGNSLQVVNLANEIEKAVGQRIPVAALFSAQSIESQAKWITDNANQQATVLIPLIVHGNGHPIFCIHSGSGLALCYLPLLHQAALDRPVYGLQMPALDAADAIWPETLATMLSTYIADIRTVQPHGPYQLIGHSAGGLIAWQLAQKLEQQDEVVSKLVLIDTFLPAEISEPPQNVLALIAALIDWRVFEAVTSIPQAQLQALPESEQMEQIVSLGRRFGWLPQAFSSQQIQRLLHAYQVNTKLVKQGSMQALNAEILHIRAQQNNYDASKGWQDIPARITMQQLPGAHETILQVPFVNALAEEVSRFVGK